MNEQIYAPDESPTPLETRADIRRALARHLRRLESRTMPHDLGQVMITGYATLAKLAVEDEKADAVLRLQQLERRMAVRLPTGATIDLTVPH